MLALKNYKYILTNKQKKFALKEAYNKMGTRKYYTKTDGLYTNTDNASYRLVVDYFSDSQAHGKDEFDIRYYILKNNNWSETEKKLLVYEFWQDDKKYEKAIRAWECNVMEKFRYVDDLNNYLDIDELYYMSFDDLYEKYGFYDDFYENYNELCFCKMIRSFEK